ncbi:MAG: 30S ribosomal protein S7 [Candidatus Pacebacteria bacterium]|nr:30S ribosomal protein S7 [Candidatus Paceibacterota bacterium]
MRRPVKKRNIPGADIKFGSDKLEKFINNVMLDGKKETARKCVYGAFDIIKEKTQADPLEVFNTAISNVGPTIEVRSRRVGGANYQVPREVRPERKQALAYRWIIDAARGGKGKPMAEKLAAELLAAFNNEGAAIKKRDDTKKMADSNKAFAHLAW